MTRELLKQNVSPCNRWPAEPRRPRRGGWSPERRARQSAMMQDNKPWLKSTGPRTAAGKARSARNAITRHGRRSADYRAALRELRLALSRQRDCVRLARLYHRARRQSLTRRRSLPYIPPSFPPATVLTVPKGTPPSANEIAHGGRNVLRLMHGCSIR